MRIIDADELDNVVIRLNDQDWQITRGEFKLIDRVLFEFPSVDAVPVRHGEWRPAYDYAEYDYDGSTPLAKPLKFQDGWQCSLCGQYELSETTYCQNCGARMDKKEDEE